MSELEKRILVTGDVALDHHVYQGGKRKPGSTMKTGTLITETEGGAVLLFQLLKRLGEAIDTLVAKINNLTKQIEKLKAEKKDLDDLIDESETTKKKIESIQIKLDILTQNKNDATNKLGKAKQIAVNLGVKFPEDHLLVSRGCWLLEPFPKAVDDQSDDEQEHWRISQSLGLQSPADHLPSKENAETIDQDYDIIVIADDDLEFRRITSQAAWPRVLNEKKQTPQWVVIKHASPIASGDLWHSMIEKHADLFDHMVCIVPINDLRLSQIRVTQKISWERTALDLAKELLNNPDLNGIRRSRFVIVNFHTDGAVLADFTDNKNPLFRLIYDPANLERDWSNGVEGTMYGLQCAFASAITAKLPSHKSTSEEIREAITDGICAGLASMRRLTSEGFKLPCVTSISKHCGFPYAEVVEEILTPTWKYSHVDLPLHVVKGSVPSPPCHPVSDNQWSIVGQDSGRGAKSGALFGLACRVALRGTSELRNIPYQQFASLFTVDRSEIESLRILRKLIINYRDLGEADKPLSIAVFGAPGSGKSFGVKQIAKAVLGKKVPILEFNLSQFNDPQELIGLFHQIRDKVLEGTMPIVFWDEFDSRELMWLQYLLAPMQDGRFQDQQISHPIGKCVFVFAGGTSHNFASFGPKPPGTNGSDEKEKEKKSEEWESFKLKKGPDFKSRLGGYLDVMGPNPKINPSSTAGGEDISFPIRRALLLRVNLELFGNERLIIDRGVLTALLEISQYEHGARSMQKIIEQIRDSSRTGEIRRSDVPPASLLNLHVDDKEFIALMERDLTFQIEVDAIAEAYHAYYREKYPPQKKEDIEYLDKEFIELHEFLKDDNRAAAKRVCEVLNLVGLYLEKGKPASPGEIKEIDQIIDANIEMLAEAEHDGWLESRIRNGWRLNEKSFPNRTHPDLIPYQDLSEKQKGKDRGAVLNYAEIVDTKGYHITTTQPKS